MADTPMSDQERREAEVVARHLPDGYEAGPDAMSNDVGANASSSAPALPEAGQESSLKLQGGDIHRDLFKKDAKARLPQRAATFSYPTRRKPSILGGGENGNEGTIQDLSQPGGMRRNFLLQNHRRFGSVTTPVTRNFVSFLELYGSFAGEDLAEDEDESAITSDDEEAQPSETRPLLGRRKSTKRMIKPGDAGQVKTFFTLLKAFIGTGIMFLPKAFRNGGMLFSSITLIVVALLSCLCFHLLLECRKRHGGGGYGELGAIIGGKWFRSIILSSITLSQIGFVCSGLIFTAENMYAFAEAVSGGKREPITTSALIGLQLVVLVPLAMIRNISKLGPVALLADVFIFFGLFYIWYYDIASLAQHGINSTVTLFNPQDFTLTIGSAIFTFEGIGLILPIQSSMKEPAEFKKLLYIIMLIITIIFTSIGALCYATFGEGTYVEIISNFPQESKLVNAVQFLYSMAVLVGEPVQLFPAVRIIETTLFGEKASGKKSSITKWKKNAFRAGMVLLCGAISILGASDLDKFVALIGSFACVPLVYIYPPFMHYKGVAKGWEKVFDIVLMVIGTGAMVYTTAITITRWVQT